MRRKTLAIVLAAGGLLLAGILLGDMGRVFINATLLCLSCIGIG